MNPANEPNPKLESFRKELEELQQRYLYRISPVLMYKSSGVFPGLNIVDIIPAKPKTETPIGTPVESNIITDDKKE